MPERGLQDPDSGQSPPISVAQALSDMARSLEGEPDLKRTVEGIVSAVTDTVPGAEAGGVSLWEGRELRTIGATSDLVTRVNNLEHEYNEGPCLSALREHRSYRVDDMSLETRWPKFARAAHANGIHSMLGYRLFTKGRTLGSLDLYSTQPKAFDGDSEVIGQLFAAHAAIALLGSTQQAEWQIALNSRDVIGMAKGILMNRDRLNDDQAFKLLISASQHANMKLYDVAQWVVAQSNDAATQAKNEVKRT
jgi:transcriptional regulator with GAF, ATPase, and Fis domain